MFFIGIIVMGTWEVKCGGEQRRERERGERFHSNVW